MVHDKRTNILNIILILIILCTLSILCGAQWRSRTNRISAIPSSVVAKMDSAIIARTGEPFFLKCLVFDSLESGLFRYDSLTGNKNAQYESHLISYPYCYSCSYWFRLPDNPRRFGLYSFIIDTIPSINEHTFDSYPDCLSDPTSCNFLIDSSMAISIAKKACRVNSLKSLYATLSPSFTPHCSWLVICDLKLDSSIIGTVSLSIDINSGKIISQDTMISHYKKLPNQFKKERVK